MDEDMKVTDGAQQGAENAIGGSNGQGQENKATDGKNRMCNGRNERKRAA
jgi:hypothetical protein